MVEEKSSEDDQKYWKSSTNKSSERLFLIFVTVFIIMLIITVSLGVYTYMRYQELHERPNIRAENALFEFENSTTDEANITVHLTLVNEGEKKSGDLTLEWVLMEKETEDENIFLIKGEKDIEPIERDGEQEVTFDLKLQQGDYTIGYRTYDEDIFSYEGRQDIQVTEDDVTRGIPEDEKEGLDEEATPMISGPIALIVILITALIWSKIRRREDER